MGNDKYKFLQAKRKKMWFFVIFSNEIRFVNDYGFWTKQH